MNILLYDNGQQFDLETPYKRYLGGSETSLILFAKGLSEIGNKVIICNNLPYDNIEQNNIQLFNNKYTLDILNQCDLIICNRTFPNKLENYINKKKIYYFSHDSYDQHLIYNWLYNYKIINVLNGFFCVSNWQKNTFFKYFNIPENLHSKFHVIGNPIDLSLYYGYSERNKNKLIYASIPYKGLEILNKIFNDVCIQTKNNDLELHIYSDMKLYDNEKLNEEYQEIYHKLRNTKNVFLNDLISMKDLAVQFKTSNLYIHPNLYHETFGMVFTQCQASGCIPITTNKGAVNEVIENNKTGIILNYPNIENRDCYKLFIDTMCDLLKDENRLYKMRINAEKFIQQFDYVKLAKKMESVLLET